MAVARYAKAPVVSFLDDLIQNHDGEILLLVAHGGSLAELVRLALGLPVERRWAFAMDDASLSELILEQDYSLLKGLNDTSHLETGK